MTRDDIQLLFEYDRWANHQVFQAAAVLSPEQFARDLRGSFRSLRDTLVHIIKGESGWLTYWNATSHSEAFLTELWDRHDILFRGDDYPDIAAVRAKWAEIEKEQIAFVETVTDEALAKTFLVHGRQLTLAQLMQHLANHSTYHRGQVALMMRQLGAQPVQTDFAFFLFQGREAGDNPARAAS